MKVDISKDLILQLYSRPETVFTLDEVSQLFPDITPESISDRLYYFNKVGKLRRLRHGVYVKKDYSSLELANKLYKPSYISLETVLVEKGIVFQNYKTIFVASYLTRTVKIGATEIQYRQIKGTVLTNNQGIEQKNGYFIASAERAFLDAVYIYKNYHFDNLGAIDWKKVTELKKIYYNRNFEKRVEEYYKMYKEDYGKN